MHRALLLTIVLLLAACVETPPPAPPRRVPDAILAPQPVPPVSAARPPATPTPRRDVLRAEPQPAANPAAESSRIARAVDGAAIASSRTGRHRFRIDQVVQRVRGAQVTMEFQARLVPSDADVLLGRVLPVRRFVTTDGFELASPEQRWDVHAVKGIVSTRAIDLGGRRHRGLRNLDLDARIFEVRGRETFTRGPFGTGTHETTLGPFPVTVIVEDEMLRIATRGDQDAERAWDASHAQPLIDGLDIWWVLGALDVRDGRGRALTGGRGYGKRGGAFLTFHVDDGAHGAPEPPITISVAVPSSYRREDTSLYFADLPFTTVEED